MEWAALVLREFLTGQRSLFKADGEQTAKQPPCFRVRKRQIDNDTFAAIHNLPKVEGQVLLSQAILQHRREGQKMPPAQGSACLVYLIVRGQAVKLPMKKRDNVFVLLCGKQAVA